MSWIGTVAWVAALTARVSRGPVRDASANLVDAVSSAYEQALDRVLVTQSRVTSAAAGRDLLAATERDEATADLVQKVVAAALPVIRLTARGARFTRIPWVLVASTAFSVGSTVRAGVREVQVLGSLVAHRLELETGKPADPALVKKLTVELYLDPKRAPSVSSRRLRLGRLVRRWVFRGTFGRGTGKSATKALDTAERLDMAPIVSRWAELGEGPER